MLRLNLCDYSDAYILVSATIRVPNITAAGANNRTNKINKNWTIFANCIREIINTQIDNAKDSDIVMSVYKVIEYSDNYSKTSGSLLHYYKDEPFLDNGAIAYFASDNNNSASFKFKTEIAGRTENDGIKKCSDQRTIKIFK